MAAQGCAPRWLLPLLQLLLLGAGAAGAQWRGEGTSRNLESIFLGRCAEYSSLLQSPAEREKNCTAIWEAFKVVLDKDPCSVLPSDYDLFINLSRHALPRDKSLFWENNHLLVTSFAENGHRLMPLCDVLYGRVGDFLSWCRQKNGSGLDYESCPSSEDCENNPVDSYWKRASIQYSMDSSGVIYVMLNGSEPKGAYPVKGFFADFEIPYLQKDKITRIEIWVMHEIRGPKVESCGEGTVKILEERLEAMGFQYSCVNDYLPVKLLMCVDHSTHPDCALTSLIHSSENTETTSMSIDGGMDKENMDYYSAFKKEILPFASVGQTRYKRGLEAARVPLCSAITLDFNRTFEMCGITSVCEVLHYRFDNKELPESEDKTENHDEEGRESGAQENEPS